MEDECFMLNRLWTGMILLGVVWACINGRISVVTQQILTSAEEAVQLCITMLGVVSMWTGIMNVANKAGILNQLTKLLNPFLQYMFPNIPQKHPAMEAIGLNIVANVLGLGWAATPAGLKAMEELEKLEGERRKKSFSARQKGVANNEMCAFLVINISSLQLIPVNLIAYRMQYGSVNPAIVVGPALIATSISTMVGIVFCKMMQRRKV